jgi:hypothetical protein
MSKRLKYVTKTFEFPRDEWAAWRFFGCYETIEHRFDIEISCGDGKFLSDIPDDSPELEKYDGMVDASTIRWGDHIHTGPFVLSIQYCEDVPYGFDEEFRNPKVSFKKAR